MRRCFVHSRVEEVEEEEEEEEEEEGKKGVIMNCNYGLYPGGNRLFFLRHRSPSVKVLSLDQEAYYHRGEGMDRCLHEINGLKLRRGKAASLSFFPLSRPHVFYLGLCRIQPHTSWWEVPIIL